MSTNIDIQSNLMVEDDNLDQQYRHLPGDFLAQVYPEKVDRRVIDKECTLKQIIEYEQYLVCSICRKPCAGTCEYSGSK